MVKNKLFIVLGTAVFLSACSAPPLYGYVKKGASERTTQSALSKCEAESKAQKAPSNKDTDFTHLCMEREGYRLERIN